MGHFFMMAVNLKRSRFELFDSIPGSGSLQYFVNMADKFKDIWKEAYRQSNGKMKPENIDDFTYERPATIPLQGET